METNDIIGILGINLGGVGMVKHFIQCVIRTILGITLLLGRYELP